MAPLSRTLPSRLSRPLYASAATTAAVAKVCEHAHNPQYLASTLPDLIIGISPPRAPRINNIAISLSLSSHPVNHVASM